MRLKDVVVREVVHAVFKSVNGGGLKGPGIQQVQFSVHLYVFHPRVYPVKPFLQLELEIQSRSEWVKFVGALLLCRAQVG